MPQIPSAIAGMAYRGARPYTMQERNQLFAQGTGAYNQPGFGPTSGAQMPQAGQPMGPVGNRMGGQAPPPTQYPQQGFQYPQWGGASQVQQPPVPQMPQQGQTFGAPPLRVSSPNAQPGMAQHLSDLLSQRNQQTALDLTRQGAYANATHGLQAQQARSRAGLGWAGIQSSDQLAAMQNQMDVINAIIRMLGNPFADLGL